MTNSVNIQDGEVSTLEEHAKITGLIIFLVDVCILEKRGENFRDFDFWHRLFTRASFGEGIASLLDFNDKEMKDSFKELFETLDTMIPIKIKSNDNVNYLVTVDKENKLYKSFFTNEAFLHILKVAEEKAGAIIEEILKNDKTKIILQ